MSRMAGVWRPHVLCPGGRNGCCDEWTKDRKGNAVILRRLKRAKDKHALRVSIRRGDF